MRKGALIPKEQPILHFEGIDMEELSTRKFTRLGFQCVTVATNIFWILRCLGCNFQSFLVPIHTNNYRNFEYRYTGTCIIGERNALGAQTLPTTFTNTLNLWSNISQGSILTDIKEILCLGAYDKLLMYIETDKLYEYIHAYILHNPFYTSTDDIQIRTVRTEKRKIILHKVIFTKHDMKHGQKFSLWCANLSLTDNNLPLKPNDIASHLIKEVHNKNKKKLISWWSEYNPLAWTV